MLFIVLFSHILSTSEGLHLAFAINYDTLETCCHGNRQIRSFGVGKLWLQLAQGSECNNTTLRIFYL